MEGSNANSNLGQRSPGPAQGFRYTPLESDTEGSTGGAAASGITADFTPERSTTTASGAGAATGVASSAAGPNAGASNSNANPQWSPEVTVAEQSHEMALWLRPFLLWFAPALVLFLAVFVQNVGLYTSTRRYVRWMDALNRPLLSASDAGRAVPSKILIQGTLDDRFAGLLGNQPLGSLLGVVGSFVPVFWLFWILYEKDLQLWTQTLLAVAVIATLKGFLAWATVLPDAGGWDSCRERLGTQGLRYFREDVTFDISDHGINFFQALLDIVLLQSSSMWSSLFSLGRRYCGDSALSSAAHVCAIFSMGIYDLSHRYTQELADNRRTLFRSVIGTLLTLIVAADSLLPVFTSLHYTADISVSLLLAILVYSNPAVAVVAARWTQVTGIGLSSWFSLLSVTMPDADGEQEPAGLDAELSSIYYDEEDNRLRDVGRVLVMSCCTPCWPSESVYHLRTQPELSSRRPLQGSSEEHGRLQLEQLEHIKDQHQRWQRDLKKKLDAERARARASADEAAKVADRNFKEALAQERRRQENEEPNLLRKAEAKLDKASNASARHRETVEGEQRRSAELESAFGEERVRLEAEAKKSQEQAAMALQARTGHERTILETRKRMQEMQLRLAQIAAQRAVRETLVAAQRNAADASVAAGQKDDAC